MFGSIQLWHLFRPQGMKMCCMCNWLFHSIKYNISRFCSHGILSGIFVFLTFWWGCVKFNLFILFWMQLVHLHFSIWCNVSKNSSTNVEVVNQNWNSLSSCYIRSLISTGSLPCPCEYLLVTILKCLLPSLACINIH